MRLRGIQGVRARSFFVLGLIQTLFFLASPAWAWPPIFGPEWEFTNKQLYHSSDRSIRQKAKALLVQSLQKRAQQTKRFHQDPINSSKFIYPDGWWFEIQTDIGVIEITAKPETAERYKTLQTRIQKDIFDVAKSLGYEPHPDDMGGGHIHIGVKSAQMFSNLLLLRNFIVDFFNHHELASGILEYDEENAPPISDYSELEKGNLKHDLTHLDGGPLTQERMIRFIDAVKKVYTSYNNSYEEKYSALNLAHIDFFHPTQEERNTLEIRSIRAQNNAKEFVLLTKLFDARIKYLKKLKTPITLGDLKPIKKDSEKIKRFKTYVEESGLSWKDYRGFLNPCYLNLRRLSVFPTPKNPQALWYRHSP